MLAVLRNLAVVPDAVATPVRLAGTWLIVLAMAGFGLGVKLSAFRSVGPRVAVAVTVSLAIMIGLTLLLPKTFGLDVR